MKHSFSSLKPLDCQSWHDGSPTKIPGQPPPRLWGTLRSLVLSGIALMLAVRAMASPGVPTNDSTFVAEFEIAPESFHRLSFNVQTTVPNEEDVRWLVHMRNSDGDLPYDGALEFPWQKIVPGKTDYSHSFLSTRDAAKLELRIRSTGKMPALANIRLDKIASDQLLLNADFSHGLDNYSGWNEFYNAGLTSDSGNPVLEIRQNGYAFTDHVPVTEGGTYKLAGRGNPAVFVYDRNKRFLDLATIPETPNHSPLRIMPKGASYARLFYSTSHSHLPQYRTNHVERAGFEPVELPDVRETAEPLRRGAREIILHAGADAREERAARELQHFAAAISGKTMPLLAQPSADENLKIYVGREWAGEFQEDMDFLKESDGYAVRRKDDVIHVFGDNSRGTLYGVYALLEKNSDIIWPRPNPEFSVVYSTDADMSFEHAEFRSRPEFAGRQISMSGHHDDKAGVFRSWQSRNGLNPPFSLHMGNNYLAWAQGARLGYGLDFLSWLTEENGNETDESFYPLIDGARSISRWRQPCYTHPKIAETMAGNIGRAMETLPDREIEHIHATIADNWSVCACETCMEPIKLPNGDLLKPKSPYSNKDPLFFSTRTFIMLNQVASILEKDYPELKIHTHAYIFTAEPPEVDIHSAVIPEFAAYPTQNTRYPILDGVSNQADGSAKDIWKRRFTEWGAKKGGELGYFGYYYVDGGAFNALADTAAADYRALHGFGAVDAHTEGFGPDKSELSAWDADGIEKWVIARLLWNPHQDPDQLRREYIRKVYRGASGEMTEFYKLIRHSWHNAPREFFVNCHSDPDALFRELVSEAGIERQTRELLVTAEKNADHPVSKRLIQRTLEFFDRSSEAVSRPVPFVDESTHEWSDAISPQWEKAIEFADFRKVDDWRRWERSEADHQTGISLMHDRKYLYVRAIAYDADPGSVVAPSEAPGEVFPLGDRVELVLRDEDDQDFYFAVGPKDHHFALPRLGATWRTRVVVNDDSWVAMIAIPLDELGWTPEKPAMAAKAGRVYRLSGDEREESTPTGHSLYNRHATLWDNLNIE